jgi:hypothetical protein
MTPIRVWRAHPVVTALRRPESDTLTLGWFTESGSGFIKTQRGIVNR